VHDPHAEYNRRIENFQQILSRKESQHRQIGNAKLIIILGGLVVAWLSLGKDLFSAYWLFVVAAIYVVLAIVHESVLRSRTNSETAVAYYRRGVARMEDRWAGTGETGDRFRDPKHNYSDDLDLFGRGCLFELLSTARLPMGENKLADWLRFPSPIPLVVDRQKLIAELRGNLELREALAVMGAELRVRLNPESLVRWAEGRRTLPTGALRMLIAVLSASAVAALVFYFATLKYWPLLIVLILETLLFGSLQKRAEAIASEISANAEGLILFSRILQRLEQEPFQSERLQQFIAALKADGDTASHAIRKLARLVFWIDARDSVIGRFLDVTVLYTIQTAFAADAWRRRWGARMHVWTNLVGEMEALLSLAAYSFEHPQDPFPEFAAEDSPAFLDGEELGHPLIPSSQCVRNSVRLDENTRVLLISGSNMSGKSTFLRTVGINAVLANAGAPIRGKSLRLSPLVVGTRIHISDSLQEHRSNFYTEILRIRQVFELMNGGRPLLFLFDELLEGTNSKDRRIGADGVMRALLDGGAIGIVTTHDLALTEITHSLRPIARNAHFQDFVEDGKMRFDYKLQEGVVAKSNALELMRLIGLKV
jgi:MutS domain V